VNLQTSSSDPVQNAEVFLIVVDGEILSLTSLIYLIQFIEIELHSRFFIISSQSFQPHHPVIVDWMDCYQ
jgi:hypothetical protein